MSRREVRQFGNWLEEPASSEAETQAKAGLAALLAADAVRVHPAVGERMRIGLADRLSAESGATKRRTAFRLVYASSAVVALLIAALGLSIEPPPFESPRAAMVQTPRSIETFVAEAPVSVPVPPFSNVLLTTGAELAVSSPLRFEVLAGSARFDVDSLPRGESLVVDAGTLTVRVIGTQFTVSRDREGIASVVVHEGRVDVKSDGQTRMLSANERWPIAEAEGAEDLPVSPVRRAPKHLVHPAKVEPSLELKDAVLAIRDGELADADRIYQTIASLEDERAATALYLLARLRAERRGAHASAVQALDQLLSQYPDHALVPEARLARAESLIALARCDEVEESLRNLRASGASPRAIEGLSEGAEKICAKE